MNDAVSGKADEASERDEAGRRAEFRLGLETLICDLHWTALHIGIVAHLLNAKVARAESWTLRSWRHLLHDDSRVMLLSLRYCRELGLSDALAARMGALYVRLAAAKRTCGELACFMQTRDGGGGKPLAAVAAEWRDLSRTASEVIGAAAVAATDKVSSLYAADARVLEGFLNAAAGGGAGWVSAWGEVTLPQLRQRRREPRVEAQQSCTLRFDGVSVRAQLVDISRKGIGVACERQIPLMRAVEIELENGRRLEAMTVRANGKRLGLLLSSGLAADDPLLRSIARHSAACCAGLAPPAGKPCDSLHQCPVRERVGGACPEPQIRAL